MNRILFILWLLFLASLTPAVAATVPADFTSLSSIPVTAASYTATGNTIQFTLNFAPPTGTSLTVVRNTGLNFIQGKFIHYSQ